MSAGEFTTVTGYRQGTCVLEPIGFGAGQERVYLALVHLYEGSVSEVAEEAGLGRAAVRDTLATLVELGLATASESRPVRYTAVPPDSAIEALVRQREAELHDVRLRAGHLTRSFTAGSRFARPDELVETVLGRDAVSRRWNELQAGAKSEVRILDRPPYAGSPDGERVSNEAALPRLVSGVRYRVVYDQAVLSLPGIAAELRHSMTAGEQSKVAINVPMKMGIFDDAFAIVPLLRDGDRSVSGSYVVAASPLLDALVALFESVWEHAVPLRSASDISGEDELTDEERDVLIALASGATDAAASRALGLSERTVQRYITRLMQRLGVGTRFQLAMEAVRRGWL
jgi:DNA-binding CsgD family transcriptional regulator/predicted DNA-binding transcriptional regulator